MCIVNRVNGCILGKEHGLFFFFDRAWQRFFVRMSSQFAESRMGRHVPCSVAGEPYSAFIPPPLPPEPPIRFETIFSLLEEASRALGELDGLTRILPDTAMFIYLYVRKEALLSSQIEGTQSSLSELLLYESKDAPGIPIDDVKEVLNYVAAMNHGLSRIREGFPLSLRLIREIHAILLTSGRGASKMPGEFRTSQNWVGGSRPGNARYVPPPPELLFEALSAFEQFLHYEDPSMPILIKAALAHVQFETIHPFLDGNGRLGRLLITFLLCASRALKEPTLYLSIYFKENRKTYYELLQKVREDGDWESWVEFFLQGVRDTANQASNTAQRILSLLEQDRVRVESIGRSAANALRVHQYLQTSPLVSIRAAAESIGLTPPTVSKAVDSMIDLEILREVTGRRRDRVFVYHRYLQILSEGTEGPPE